ncbi:MAG: DNA topoisomerase (ATP-hydrolyzing) subunit A [Spirochaetales bacterium]|jgi:DNA gyrase subunit A|nr:DNA topoisomerase (ATP-hydrolyzing) subunit A [Spirochaetales bacterium]
MVEQTGKIIRINIEEEMKSSYLNYAMSVIVSRALPDVRDGLKPVHRRILYDMFEMGLRANTPFRKSARIVGDVLGKYHPHGDASVYDALVRLAQDFSLRYPVVQPQGNFGSIDGDPPAAMRYTEAKLSRIGEEMLNDIQKETVNFGPNYDDSMEEPQVLPAAIPFLLANGSSGIAVGMATNMAPHNLKEICAATAAYIDNPHISLPEIMEHIKGPDFPTAGIICGRSGIIDAFSTGRGRIVMRGRYEIEDEGGRDQIIFTELPYQVNKADLVKRIADLRKTHLQSVNEVRDESDRDGIRIVIELKKGAVARVVVNLLFLHTQLQTNFNVNNLALVDGRPQQLGLIDMIKYYVEHREEVLERRTQFDLAKAQERAHILEGLKIGLENIDEVIKVIKEAADNSVAAQSLKSRFGLTDIQAQAIIDMRLGRLSHLESEKILSELAELHAKIIYYKELLSDRAKILQVVKDEILTISDKYGDERRSEITHEELSGMNIEDFIKRENVVAVISNRGFVKRVPVDEYRSQGRGGVGVRGVTLRSEDFIEHLFVASTHDYLMVVTNLGQAYWFKVHELATGSRTSRGESIKKILPFADDEEITEVINFSDFDEDLYILMATRNGIVKKVNLPLFRNARTRGIRAIILDEGDVLVSSILIEKGTDCMIVTRKGRGLRFADEGVRAMGRASRGVIGIRLTEGDSVVGLMKVNPEKRMLLVTEKGQGKQVEFDQFRRHNRATMGQKIYTFRDKTGYLVGTLAVSDDDDLVCITANGQSIRTPVESISIQGAYASGVAVARLREDDTVVAIARTEAECEEEEEE